MKAQPGLPARRSQPQLSRQWRARDYVRLSGTLAVAAAISILIATSDRMLHLKTQGGSKIKVRLKTWDHMDPDQAAAGALDSHEPNSLRAAMTGNRLADSHSDTADGSLRIFAEHGSGGASSGMQEKDGNSLREGIWLIDLTVNDQEALKDGEDTYMVKMYKDLEAQRHKEDEDAAREAGSAVLELEKDHPAVERIRSLGARLRGSLGQTEHPFASGEATQEESMQPQDSGKGSKADMWQQNKAEAAQDGMRRGIDTPLRLVTLFRDRQVYHEPENPKLGTWKQDLTRREQELEDMNAARRRNLERERAHLFPHIPVMDGILERAMDVGVTVKDLNRPASVEDLLDGAELEQRLREEGRLQDILRDPELMPDWEAQLEMQQAQ